MSGRNQFPELEGTDADSAASTLQGYGLNPRVLPQGSAVTRDFRLDRVRVFTDSNNKVVGVPRVG